MTGQSRGVMVIDLFGLTEEEVRQRFPTVFQHLLQHVKPERDQNPRSARREKWWLFGENVLQHRVGVRELSRYIATVESAKYRLFVFQSVSVIPDNKLICVASDKAFDLGLLSSNQHIKWSIAAGSWIGFGNDPVYVKTRCFDPFPFPTATIAQAAVIAALAEELDALRKTRLVPLHRGFDGLSVSRIERGQVGAVYLDGDAPSCAGMA